VTTELQHDLDNRGIAKNAREEKKRARDAKAVASGIAIQTAEIDHSVTPVPGHRGPVKNDEAYNARMASLYREVVLKEKPAVAENGFIPLGALGKANGGIAPAPKPEVAEPVAGD
jgi:7,8-dihydro-6-hydroxymethylpterin dimethyltransferase